MTQRKQSFGTSNYISQSRRPDSVSRAQNRPPASILKGAGHGFSLGRGKASGSAVPSDNPNHQSNSVGLFKPSYRDYGSRGRQSSAALYIPRAGTYMSYRPQGAAHDHFWQPRGGAASSGDSWRSNNEWRQETNQGCAGRGQGRGRGWSATKS